MDFGIKCLLILAPLAMLVDRLRPTYHLVQWLVG